MSFPTSHSAHHWNILSLKVFPSDIEVFFMLFFLFVFSEEIRTQQERTKTLKQSGKARRFMQM